VRMKKTTAGITIGSIVALLGVIGLFAGEGTIMSGAMNVDITLDIIRVLLGGYLIYGSMRSLESEKMAMEVFGVAYLAIFILGLFTPTLFGLIPSGLGWFDQLLHIGGGILAMWLVGAIGTTGSRVHRA
jgi:hypothetical protein